VSTIVTRAGKGSPLTHNEVDANFTNLNADKVETSALSELIDDRVAALAVAGTNMTITYNDGAGTLTFDAAGGGGSPGGSTGEVQFNNAGAFDGAPNVQIEGDELRLVSVAAPTAPASGGIKVFSQDRAGQPWPHFRGPLGNEDLALQPLIANGNYKLLMVSSATTLTAIGINSVGVGTATGLTVGVATRLARMKRLAYRVTVAATNAVSGWRDNSGQLSVGGGNAWEGGFWGVMHGGPDTGASTSTHRFFMGVGSAAAPTDVEPSSLTRIAGIGYDAADTNLQFMHNDGSGTATKIDLGSGLPKPSVASSTAYRLRLYSPPGTTQVIYYEVDDLDGGGSASGSVNTDLPATNDLITPFLYTSVGGTSSVIGTMVGPIMFQTED
jgi:hypothetical protein